MGLTLGPSGRKLERLEHWNTHGFHMPDLLVADQCSRKVLTFTPDVSERPRRTIFALSRSLLKCADAGGTQAPTIGFEKASGSLLQLEQLKQHTSVIARQRVALLMST